jgi:transposase
LPLSRAQESAAVSSSPDNEEMKKQHVKLSVKDRAYLESLICKGKLPAKTFKRATGLLELDRGKTLTAVVETLGVSYVTVAAWRDGYKKQGLKCLKDASRSGRQPEIDGKLRAKITALACSEAPEGHAKWSLRLLAEKVIEAEYCEEISQPILVRFSKKRVDAASQADLVHWPNQWRVYRADGRTLMALWTTLRSAISGHLLR